MKFCAWQEYLPNGEVLQFGVPVMSENKNAPYYKERCTIEELRRDQPDHPLIKPDTPV